jgi:hypothetical protein
VRRASVPKENDLEGPQDQGGKHGGQAGMPRPESEGPQDQGIVLDERGQEQPADKNRAQTAPKTEPGHMPQQKIEKDPDRNDQGQGK